MPFALFGPMDRVPLRLLLCRYPVQSGRWSMMCCKPDKRLLFIVSYGVSSLVEYKCCRICFSWACHGLLAATSLLSCLLFVALLLLLSLLLPLV